MDLLWIFGDKKNTCSILFVYSVLLGWWMWDWFGQFLIWMTAKDHRDCWGSLGCFFGRVEGSQGNILPQVWFGFSGACLLWCKQLSAMRKCPPWAPRQNEKPRERPMGPVLLGHRQPVVWLGVWQSFVVNYGRLWLMMVRTRIIMINFLTCWLWWPWWWLIMVDLWSRMVNCGFVSKEGPIKWWAILDHRLSLATVNDLYLRWL